MPLDYALTNREKLVNRNKVTAAEVLKAFQQSYNRLQSSLDIMLAEIQKKMEAGETIDQSFLFERSRLEILLTELGAEIDMLSQELGQITTSAQSQNVLAAIGETNQILKLDQMLSGEIVGLDTGAMRELVGLSSNGQPIEKLFQKLKPALVEKVKDALITGVAAGSGAPAIATEIKNALGTSTAHAQTIARTETNNAYRESSRLAYHQNKKIVVSYVWVSARDLRTCPICWAMHGREFKTSEKFATHPNCRCVLLPMLPDSEKVKAGAESFRELTEAQQREILGSRRYELYKQGSHDLDDFVGERKTEFGKSRYLKPIDDLAVIQGNYI